MSHDNGVHEMGAKIAAARSDLRSLGEMRCPKCPGQARLLCAAYVWTNGTAYLWIPAYSTLHKRKRPARGVPFHEEADGRPHVESVSCPRCRHPFLVEIYADRVDVSPAATSATRGTLAE